MKAMLVRMFRFGWHYASRIMGGISLTFALFLMVSLVSYDSTDPSFNRSSEGAAANLGGSAGAFIADPVLQAIGITALLPIAVLLTWGIRFIYFNKAPWLWLKLIMLLVAIPTTAGLLAMAHTPEIWPIDTGLGGFIGKFVHDETLFRIPQLAFVAIMLPAAFMSSLIALGIPLREWWIAIKWTSIRTYKLTRLLMNLSATLVRLGLRAMRREPLREEAEPYEEIAVAQEEKPKKRKLVEFASKEKTKPKAPVARQGKLKLSNEFELPSLGLLASPSDKRSKRLSESALSQNAKLLEKVLQDFGVQGHIVKIRPGPVVTLYELEPSPGTKSSRVIGLADDIARSMSAVSARIAVIPGRNAIGIELPNTHRETVFLRETIEAEEYRNPKLNLPIALGKDIGGGTIVVDLAKMPHLLVAGTTGSGKSVAINAMILSLIYRLTPEECKFIMIDPKMLELSIYDGIPHLLAPVVTEPGKAVVALKWVVREMEQRYRLMSNLGVRNISGYNTRIEQAKRQGEVLERTVQTGFDPETGKPTYEKVAYDMNPLPFIVVVVDEMADLMLVAGKDIEASIQRLAQMARAAGIHIIMATQRPSVDVITGVIKANFPTRISFSVTSRIDSRTILGEQGAEQLLGMGDMLYMEGGSRINRVHGPFVDDKEVEAVVTYLKEQGEPNYIESVTEADEEEASLDLSAEGGKSNDLYDQAVAIVCRDGRASTSYIQRQLKIGYNRAADLIDRMEQEGVVSPANHAGKREVLVQSA